MTSFQLQLSDRAVSIFAEWQRLREVKVPVLDCGGLFKEFEKEYSNHFKGVSKVFPHSKEFQSISKFQELL